MRIGLEVHVALPTKTKLFCSCSSHAKEVNSSICPICMGMPGSKPMLNKEALRLAKSISLGLNATVNETTSFIRKVYFYPDLPKSFQITQLSHSIGIGGCVRIGSKTVGIRRIQIEEDPAKIIREDDYTLLDFNRSGVALVEIVTEPDISSLDELREFLTELRSILYYSGINISEEVKADVNISLDNERVEIKNVTGVNNVIAAARYEIDRQGEIIRTGGRVRMETRSYDETSMKTVGSREKETEEEYGFIYEPDLTDFDSGSIKADKPIIASEVAGSIAETYGLNLQTLRELSLFDMGSLRLIQLGVVKDPKAAIGVVESLKKLGRMDVKDDVFYKLIENAARGLQITADILGRIERDETVSGGAKGIDQKAIDDDIIDTINKRQDLLIEYRTNKKVFNFLVGMLIKKYSASPRYVAERLAALLDSRIDRAE
jgi:aspartyl-tRNA(Asn)/glutamyl-tRNA(Gln) amidotransferase subunit B